MLDARKEREPSYRSAPPYMFVLYNASPLVYSRAKTQDWGVDGIHRLSGSLCR